MLLGIFALGLTARVLHTSFGFIETFDWINYRLPIAEALGGGQVLYRDVPYDHMPLYPYYTGLMYRLFGGNYLAIMSLAIVGDSLIAPLLYRRTGSVWIAGLYAASAVSIISCGGDARWDGLTVLFLLLALSYDDDKRFSAFTAVGITLKQFPVFALIRVLLGRKEVKKLVFTAVMVAAVLSPFLLFVAGDFVDGMLGHSVYQQEEEVAALRVGTMSDFIGQTAWAFIFSFLVIVTLLTMTEDNYRNTVGIIVFLFTFMMYLTHNHTGVIFVPFALLLMQRSRYWIFAYLWVQYFVLLRLDYDPLANYLFPLAFVIWVFLVRENIRIAGDSYAGPSDILNPVDGKDAGSGQAPLEARAP